MGDKNFNRVVKVLAAEQEKQKLDQRSVYFVNSQRDFGVDEKELRVIAQRLVGHGHATMLPGAPKFVVLASIIDYDKELNKRRDIVADVRGWLNSKWWWAYPALLLWLLLSLLGGLAVFDVTPKDMLKQLTGKVEQQQALPEPVKQNDVP